MAKIVQSKTCPTCGAAHPTGVVQQYSIPEVPVLDEKMAKEFNESIQNMKNAIDNIKFPEVKIPEGLDDFCTKFPDLCKQVDHLGERINHIGEIIDSHPKPTKNLEKIWDDCEECKDLWGKWKGEIGEEAATKAIQEYEQKKTEEATKAEEEAKETEAKEIETKETEEETPEPAFPWMAA